MESDVPRHDLGQYPLSVFSRFLIVHRPGRLLSRDGHGDDSVSQTIHDIALGERHRQGTPVEDDRLGNMEVDHFAKGFPGVRR